MGRPTKCTNETISRISSAVSQGCTIEAACAASGISTSTYREWRALGAKGVRPYSAFLASIKKAESDAESRLLGIINDAAPKTWQAAAWILERRFPKKWSRRSMPPLISLPRIGETPKSPSPISATLLDDDWTIEEIS